METTTGPWADLIDVLDSAREPFDEWVVQVSEAFHSSRLTIEAASRLAGTTTAELAAILQLATMEEEDLALLATNVPPKTTWFQLSQATSQGVAAALTALEQADPGASPSKVVADALLSAEGPTAVDRVAELDGKTFGHLAKKARQYDVLSSRARSALANFARRRRGGRPLTPRQAAFAFDLVTQLVNEGAVRRESPDGDVEICDAVLDALHGTG